MRLSLDPAGVEALGRDAAVSAHTLDVTATLRDTARAASPRRTGHFSLSFTTTSRTDSGITVGELGNTDAGATAIEFGSINNRPFSPMRQAARSLGLRLSGDQ